MTHKIHLPQDYAAVLQQIHEDGEDDFDSLIDILQFERPHLAHIISELFQKGLIRISHESSRQAWLSLTGKGQRFVRYVWPEAQAAKLA